jgi:hypothetical protein
VKNPAVESWSQAWDAYLEVLGKAAEGTLTSPEFLRAQRRTLDLLCSHRDMWLKTAAGSLPAAVPARIKTKKNHGLRRRRG